MRTYLFAHTTNRVDVELGARLFRHLMALPLSYFQSRRVGDSVARVRELENIRVFLTSSALTLVLDLFFTLVFVGVMFFYSLLSWIVIAAFPYYIGISIGVAPYSNAGSTRSSGWRGKPGVPGRERRGRRDRQGDGSRTADAAALGGPARQLRLGQLPRAQPRQHDQRIGAAHRQAGQCRGAVRRQARHRRQPDDRRTGRHDRQPGQRPVRLARIWQDFFGTRLSVGAWATSSIRPPEPTYAPRPGSAATTSKATSSSTMSTSATGPTVSVCWRM